jgi:hypothetical protein
LTRVLAAVIEAANALTRQSRTKRGVAFPARSRIAEDAMGSALLELYVERISEYDRMVSTGTLPTVCCADRMTKFLNATHVRIFNYPGFAEPLRERAAALASEASIAVEHLGKKHIRKEAVVAKLLAARGEHPRMVHIISTMEGCDTYNRRTTSRPTRPICARTAGSACTTISTSWMLSRRSGPAWSAVRLVMA